MTLIRAEGMNDIKAAHALRTLAEIVADEKTDE